MKYPVESNLLKKGFIQLGYIFLSIVFSSIFYLPVYFHHDIVTIQKMNNQTVYNRTLCDVTDEKSKPIVLVLSFINRIFLPIILVFLFSILLIFQIKTSKSRVYILYSPREIEIFKKDVKLSIISIISNTLSIILNLPLILVVFIVEYSDLKYFFAYNAFYFSNAINFYLYFIAYLLFRKTTTSNTNDYIQNRR